jgi:hypothetical protein
VFVDFQKCLFTTLYMPKSYYLKGVKAPNPFQDSTTPTESVAQDLVLLWSLLWYYLSQELVLVCINVTAETQFWKLHF